MPLTLSSSQVIPLTSGRLGSDPIIHEREINQIKQSFRQKDVVKTMDRIKDWFCRTHRVEAKKCLYNVMHSADQKQQVQSFLRLKELAAEPFRKDFIIELKHDGVMDLKIRKNYSVNYLHEQARNHFNQFTKFNAYSRVHESSCERAEMHNKPEAMNALLQGQRSFPKCEKVMSCFSVGAQDVSPKLHKTAYRVITKEEVAAGVSTTKDGGRSSQKHGNTRSVEAEFPNYLVTVYHSNAGNMCVGGVRAYDPSIE